MSKVIFKKGQAYLKWTFDTVPMSLFKYTKLSSLKQILSTNQFIFRNPTEFDDPFDCNLRIETPKNLKKIKSGLALHTLYKQNKLILEIKAQEIFDNIEFHDELNREVTRERVKTYGVHCFTKDSNNFKMWEQYADKHNGVCIGFSMFYDTTNFFKTSHRVRYVNKYPILSSLDFLDMEKDALIKLMTIKHKSYSYEKEIRVWKDPNLINYTFDKSCLRCIILGHKLNYNVDELNQITSLIIDNGYPDIKLLQAHLLPDKKSLIYELINYKLEYA